MEDGEAKVHPLINHKTDQTITIRKPYALIVEVLRFSFLLDSNVESLLLIGVGEMEHTITLALVFAEERLALACFKRSLKTVGIYWVVF